MSPRVTWPEGGDAVLREWWGKVSVLEIANRVGVSHKAVRFRAQALCLPPLKSGRRSGDCPGPQGHSVRGEPISDGSERMMADRARIGSDTMLSLLRKNHGPDNRGQP